MNVRVRRDSKKQEIEKLKHDRLLLVEQLGKVGGEVEDDAAERERLSMSEAKANEEVARLEERERALRSEVQAIVREGGALDLARRGLEMKRARLDNEEEEYVIKRRRLVETTQARKDAEAGLEKLEAEFTSKRRRFGHFLAPCSARSP